MGHAPPYRALDTACGCAIMFCTKHRTARFFGRNAVACQSRSLTGRWAPHLLRAWVERTSAWILVAASSLAFEGAAFVNARPPAPGCESVLLLSEGLRYLFANDSCPDPKKVVSWYWKRLVFGVQGAVPLRTLGRYKSQERHGPCIVRIILSRHVTSHLFAFGAFSGKIEGLQHVHRHGKMSCHCSMKEDKSSPAPESWSACSWSPCREELHPELQTRAGISK